MVESPFLAHFGFPAKAGELRVARAKVAIAADAVKELTRFFIGELP
jgi:hypothetical protein